MIRLMSWSARLIVCLSVAVAFGCAESEIAKGTQSADAGADGSLDADNNGTVDAGDSGGEDVRKDTSGQIAYESCVLNEQGPWGTCAEDGTLAFGTVFAGETLTRLARLDNTGEVALEVTAATIADANFTVQPLRYTDEAEPTATDETLPATLAAGESLFFEVSVTGPGQDGDFEAAAMEVLVDTGAGAEETVSIPLSGSYGLCGPGTADCDGDMTNGCEVNTASDTLNCGACGNRCVFDNATAVCNAGTCEIDACSGTFDDCDQDATNGCEANLNSLNHCGGCGTVCDYANATEQCSAGSCIFEGCEGSFDDCDGDVMNGCEVDTDQSLSHCGGCGQVCAFDNANAACNTGSCDFDGCLNGWVDLNGDTADGCEYQCTFQSADDAPDPSGVDANCDGIDGDASRGIFVSTNGSDAAAGTIDAPLASVSAAISMAQSTSGLDQIFVAAGQYEEQVTLADGVSIYGGYDATSNWTRNATTTSRIFYAGGSGKMIAVKGSGITSATVLSMLDIATADATGTGANNYALYCNNCGGLTIRSTMLTSGAAANGQDGAAGATGFDAYGRGYDGSSGGTGSCDGSSYGRGGSGGSSGCGRSGGRGGNGGGEGDDTGDSGSYGNYGISGGYGGSSSGADGGPGGIGTDGANGSNGQGGSSGQVVGGYWSGDSGDNGTDGEHGNGGGGGGGGSGQSGFWVNDGSGNGGGGGGGGGCGGIGGIGGEAGGSSFGLFLVDSSGITLENNVITSGNGGNGGAGGEGGNGSGGGSGAAGGRSCTSEVGAGGSGGAGGDGGNGGNGGGGAGGNSYGIYRANTNLTLPGTNTINTGQAGRGGTSSGNAGSDGVAARY